MHYLFTMTLLLMICVFWLNVGSYFSYDCYDCLLIVQGIRRRRSSCSSSSLKVWWVGGNLFRVNKQVTET